MDVDGMQLSKELTQLLKAAFPDAEARVSWLHRPSGTLDGRIPVDLLRSGRELRVIEALASFEDGVFS